MRKKLDESSPFRIRGLRALFFAVALFVIPGTGIAQDIKLGMSAAFTGAIRGLGIELYRGSMAYFGEINDRGGVHGRRIALIPYDDQYNPVATILNTSRLVQDDNVFALFDYVGTPTVTRILPQLRKHRNRNVFLFFPFTGAQPQRTPPSDKIAFNLRASYHQEVQAMVDNLVRVGRTRICVFYQMDAYGLSGRTGVELSLARHNLRISGEAFYFRGSTYKQSMLHQVKTLEKTGPDAVICVGAYGPCAAFIREARDAGLSIPICNVSFVGSENMLALLLRTGEERGKDYTRNLINSQVVPSYEDISLPAVAEYRQLMDKWNVMPPTHLMAPGYKPRKYSPVSLEGFLNAKLMVEILRRLGRDPQQKNITNVVESVRNYDLGIGVPITFGPNKHQGLDKVFLTTVSDGRFVAFKDWGAWKK